MNGRVPVLGRRHHRRARATDVRAAACSIATSRAGTTTASSATTSRPTRGAMPSSGRVRDHGRRAGDRVRGLPRPGRRARARQRRPAAALRAAPRRRAPIRRSSTRRASRPRARADLCGRCHGQRITADVGAVPDAHGDPFVPGDDLARYSAPLWRDTPLRGERARSRARFWDDGTPRLTAYEYQGLLQSALRRRRAGSPAPSCHGMHEGDPRGQLRDASRGRRTRTRCARACHAAAGRRPPRARAHARPRSGGRGGALRRAATCRASSTACSTFTAATGSNPEAAARRRHRS